MKLMGFNASPRKNGNTAWIISKILDVAKKNGAETEMFHSAELDIKPCCGCLGCKKGGMECVINDDMQKLYEKIKEADALLLGSPVYMGQMSGQAKIFTDRLFAHFSPRFSPHFKEGSIQKKKLLLVFDQGNPDIEKFRTYFDYTKEMFQMLEFDVLDVQVVAGLRAEPAEEKEGLGDALNEVGSSLLSRVLSRMKCDGVQ